MRRLFAALVAVALFAVPSSAAAEARQGAGGDPQDQPPSLDGPSQPDIEQVRTVYDAAGTLTLTMRFYAPLPDPAHESARFAVSQFGDRGLDQGRDPQTQSEFGCSAYHNGDATVDINDVGRSYDTNGALLVGGYSGLVWAPTTFSADRREVSVSFSHAAIANRGYVCTDAFTYVGCGFCRIDQMQWFYLDGFAPATPPSSSSPAPQVLDTMTNGDALYYARRGIRQGSKKARLIKAKCTRASRTSFNCKVRWRSTKFAFAGTMRVYYGFEGREEFWYYTAKLTRTDTTCTRRPGRRCTRKVIWR